MKKTLLEKAKDSNRRSSMEKDVQKLVDQGLTFQEIAEKLGISRHSVWNKTKKGIAYQKAYRKTEKFKAYRRAYQKKTRVSLAKLREMGLI